MNTRSPIQHSRTSKSPFSTPFPVTIPLYRSPNYPRVVVRRCIQVRFVEERVVEDIAGGTSAFCWDRVRDFDGEVEDGVHVCSVETEVLADGDLILLAFSSVICDYRRTLYAPREVFPVSVPSPTKQSGQIQFTCFTVELGSCAIISPKLALFVPAVPFDIVKFLPVV